MHSGLSRAGLGDVWGKAVTGALGHTAHMVTHVSSLLVVGQRYISQPQQCMGRDLRSPGVTTAGFVVYL